MDKKLNKEIVKDKSKKKTKKKKVKKNKKQEFSQKADKSLERTNRSPKGNFNIIKVNNESDILIENSSKSKYLQDLIDQIPFEQNNISEITISPPSEKKSQTITKKDDKIQYEQTSLSNLKSSPQLVQKYQKRFKSNNPKSRKSSETKYNKSKDISKSNKKESQFQNLFPRIIAPTLEFYNQRNSLRESLQKKNNQNSRELHLNSSIKKIQSTKEVNIANIDVEKFCQNEIKEYQKEIAQLEDIIQKQNNKLEDQQEFVYFLQGKYNDKTSLENLRGKKLKEYKKEILNLKEQTTEKDNILMDTINENNFIKEKFQEYIDKFNQEEIKWQEKLEQAKIIQEASKKQMLNSQHELKKVQIDFDEHLKNYQKAEKFIEELRILLVQKDKEISTLMDNIKLKDQKLNDFNNKLQVLENHNQLQNKLTPDNYQNQNDEIYQQIQDDHKKKVQQLKILHEQQQKELQEQLIIYKEFYDKYQKELRRTNSQKNINSMYNQQSSKVKFDKQIQTEQYVLQKNNIAIQCDSWNNDIIQILQQNEMMYPDVFNFDVSELDLSQLQSILTKIFTLLKETIQQKRLDQQIIKQFELEQYQMEEKNLQLNQKLEQILENFDKKIHNFQAEKKELQTKLQKYQKLQDQKDELEKSKSSKDTQTEHKQYKIASTQTKEDFQAKIQFLTQQNQQIQQEIDKLTVDLQFKNQQVQKLTDKINQQLNKEKESSQKIMDLTKKNSQLKGSYFKKISDYQKQMQEIKNDQNQNYISIQEYQKLEQQLKKTQNNQQQFQIKNKFLLEILSPQETIQLFRKFLRKIEQSSYLKNQILEVPEMQKFLDN